MDEPSEPREPRVWAGKRAGRSHRVQGFPCQDAFAAHADPGRGRAVAALADGLGSEPLSHVGSQAACDAAVATLRAEPAWDAAALTRAFEAARQAVVDEAGKLGAAVSHLATTLEVVAVADGRVLAGMVGDGAVVAGLPPTPLLLPPEGRYANEVVPLTSRQWQENLAIAEAPASGPVLVFSDGLTRLLLSRSKRTWSIFTPFFDAFLPQLANRDAGPSLGANVVQRFLDQDAVDRAWDDDKSLVVIDPGAMLVGASLHPSPLAGPVSPIIDPASPLPSPVSPTVAEDGHA